MEYLLLIPSLLVFLYSLYKLSGDDHVLIRKNISLEQMFDSAFNTLWISLVISRIFYFLIYPVKKSNVFIAFFSTSGGLSLSGALAGGIIALYFISRLKRMPIGRLFDFFTMSLVYAFPVGFILMALIGLPKHIIIPYYVSAVSYLLIAILFRKLLYPKLLNRTMKEGMISIYFFLLFPLISFAVSLLDFTKRSFTYITIDNFIYGALFILGLVLYIKQERVKLRRRA